MNREIKFRAWHKEIKAMYWFDVMNGMSHNIGSGYIPMAFWGEPITKHRFKDNLMPIDPMDCELMQFTGLKDKNGVEIYEGDILAKKIDSQHQYRVKFRDLKFTSETYVLDIDEEENNYWRLQYNDHPIQGALTYDNIVIGNIYENPELLK